MITKKLFFQRHSSNNAQHDWLLSEYVATQQRHQQVVKQVGFLSYIKSLFFLTSEKVISYDRPVVEYFHDFSEAELVIANCCVAPIQNKLQDGNISYSWLHDLSHSLYLEEVRLFKKLRKLFFCLKYFFESYSKTHNLLHSLIGGIYRRIHSMMISDKSGEGDIASVTKNWKEILSNHFYYNQNGKENKRIIYTRY